jgi:hypothetical protein
MSTCPHCGAAAADITEEIAHMRERHPDVINERLAAVGETPREIPGMSVIERDDQLQRVLNAFREPVSAENAPAKVYELQSRLVRAEHQLRGAVEERDFYRAALERMAARAQPDGLATHTLACARSRFGGQSG